jgi:hypothetical protein
MDGLCMSVNAFEVATVPGRAHGNADDDGLPFSVGLLAAASFVVDHSHTRQVK